MHGVCIDGWSFNFTCIDLMANFRQRRLYCESLENRRLLTADLVIHEIMASNGSTLLDEDQDSSDWIEILNRGNEVANLKHFSLTDDPRNLNKWQFPPHTQIAPDEYLIVFASGKNRMESEELHANFKLSSSGEFLALVENRGGTNVVIDAFSPAYPKQNVDVSYGVFMGTENSLRYFMQPTPGQVNSSDGAIGLVSDISFSVDRGFYEKSDQPLTVKLATTTAESTIVYSTNGSAPTAEFVDGQIQITNGIVYSAPLQVASTTTLRAAAFKTDHVPTQVDTKTYLFLDDVIRQTGDGLSETWGRFPNSTSIGGTPWRIGQDVPSDWAMDQSIVDDPNYQVDLMEGLRTVPTIALSIDPDDLFGKDGIYVHPLRRGDRWERPISIEYLDVESDAEFQINAGVRIHGGASRRPDQTRKHSLRLKFRGVYDGYSKLDFPFFEDAPFGESAVKSFDTLTLRGSYSDGFSVGDLSWSPINLRDQWARDVQLAMGQPAAHGKFVHVYINGRYWGLYNATERIEGSFVEAYLGGDKDNADVITDDGLNEGSNREWARVLALARGGLASNDAYEELQELVDVDSLIDYMLVQAHSGNWDWPQNNWLAVRNRDNGKFHFPVWDVEVGLGAARNASGHDLQRNRVGVNNAGTPAQIYAALRANEEFRLRFADRIQQHFFNQGPLSAERSAELFDRRVAEVFQAIVAETARWGDHNGIDGSTRNLPYKRDDEWLREIEWIRNTWFPQRTQIVLDQFRNIRLYPETAPAEFHVNDRTQHGGTIGRDDKLKLHAPQGDIWFTIDDSDPRLPPDLDLSTIKLFDARAPVSVLVPSVENNGSELGDRWRIGEPFDDSMAHGWIHGENGVGFERGGDGSYTDRIQIDVEKQMDGIQGSVFIRIPFRIDEGIAEQLKSLTLKMQYDDGFVAYLNGQEVSRVNFGQDEPQWDSFATRSNESLNYASFDLSNHADLLRDGENLLAIHGMNRSTANGDMLFLAELVAGGDKNEAQVSTSAVLYDGAPITLHRETPIHVRVFSNGDWSALTAATFKPQPLPGDFNADERVDIVDVNLLSAGIQASDLLFDLTADSILDQTDMDVMIKDILGTHFGDANLDGQFNSHDLVLIFQIGEYEDSTEGNSTWGEGDWNADGEFDSSDLVLAFQDDGFVAN